MRCLSTVLFVLLAATAPAVLGTPARAGDAAAPQAFSVHPIGHVGKTDGKTTIVLDPKYRPGLLGMQAQDDIWVLWWFDRNDTPEQRAILQVHPRGNPDNPLTGVFATRAPVRPNLIGLTRCRVVAVAGNVVEIDRIDAFPDTPVLDIKRAFETAN